MSVFETDKQHKENKLAESERLRKAYKTGEYIDEFTTTPESPMQSIPPLWRIKLDGRPTWMSEKLCKKLYGKIYK